MSGFEQALPVIFLGLMGFSMLMYVVLDGYDLGVGMWLTRATPDEKDIMVASIGPFWDANETWLVLGVGILLIAFPDCAWRGAHRALPAGGRHADRAHHARRGLRLPREGKG